MEMKFVDCNLFLDYFITCQKQPSAKSSWILYKTPNAKEQNISYAVGKDKFKLNQVLPGSHHNSVSYSSPCFQIFWYVNQKYDMEVQI